jgi:hypothetical protein
MSFRTDRNNNPTAFTTDIAREAGLIEHTDYERGDAFEVGPVTYFTAKILGDPIYVTIEVIDKLTFYTKGNKTRWTYIAIPQVLWSVLVFTWKKKIIQFMYHNEGGTAMEHLFS